MNCTVCALPSLAHQRGRSMEVSPAPPDSPEPSQSQPLPLSASPLPPTPRTGMRVTVIAPPQSSAVMESAVAGQLDATVAVHLASSVADVPTDTPSGDCSPPAVPSPQSPHGQSVAFPWQHHRPLPTARRLLLLHLPPSLRRNLQPTPVRGLLPPLTQIRTP